MKLKGNIVQIVKNEPHTEIKPHYHKKMIEIYHILKGKAIVFAETQELEPKLETPYCANPEKFTE